MVPTSTGKPGKTIVDFLAKGKSGNCELTRKVREFYIKYWKRKGNLPKILKK